MSGSGDRKMNKILQFISWRIHKLVQNTHENMFYDII